jgi:hypothetical protein
VAVQVAALAFMVGNPVSGIEFELAGNSQHRVSSSLVKNQGI